MSTVDCSKCGAQQQSTGGQCHYCGASLPTPPPAYQPPPPPQNYSAPQVPQIIVIRQSNPSYSTGSSFSWYWTMRLGVAGIFIFMSAGGWLWHKLTGQKAPAAIAALSDDDGDDAWDGKTPLSCAGNDDIKVTGVKATFTAGSAITASGNCHVTCTDCTLKAPTAVEATGNGGVTLINGSAEGTEASLVASGNGEIDVKGNATIVGPTKHSANGRVSGVPAAVASAATAAHPAASPHAAHGAPSAAPSASAKKK